MQSTPYNVVQIYSFKDLYYKLERFSWNSLRKPNNKSHLFELLEDGNIVNSTITYTTLQTKELEDLKNSLEIERKATTTLASIA